MIEKLPNFSSRLAYVSKMLAVEAEMMIYIDSDAKMGADDQRKFISKYIVMLEETLDSNNNQKPVSVAAVNHPCNEITSYEMGRIMSVVDKDMGKIAIIKEFRSVMADVTFRHGKNPNHSLVGLKDAKDEVERVLQFTEYKDKWTGATKYDHRWLVDVWEYEGILLATDLLVRNQKDT